MDDPQFEIIEDEPQKPKRKRSRKRKYRPLFGHMPWSLLSIAFASGILVAGLLIGGLIVMVSSTNHSPALETIPFSPANTPIIATRAADDPVYRAAWAGDTVAVASSQALRLYPGNGNAPAVLASEGFAEALTLSPDGKQAAVMWTVYPKSAADASFYPYNPIDIVDVATGQQIRRIDAHTFLSMASMYGSVTAALAYSPDGTLLASGSRDGHIKVWDMPTGGEVAALATDGASSTLALSFTADGQHIAAVVRYGEGAGDPGTHDELRVWSTGGYQPESGVNLQLQAVSRTVFSPDGRYLGLIADGGRFIDIRDVLSGASIGQIVTGADGIARELTLGADHLLGVVYFWAGTATPEPGQPGGDRVELRAVQWQAGTNFLLETETRASKTDYLYLGDIAALHFEPDEGWLDYVPQTGSTLWRWNLADSSLAPLNL